MFAFAIYICQGESSCSEREVMNPILGCEESVASGAICRLSMHAN